MPKSPAYARIKGQVLAITAAIPVGRVTSFRAIGDYLDVVPRHVAYILATLTPEEQLRVPWQRVVSDTGKLGRAKLDALGQSQADLLRAEGVTVTAQGVLPDYDRHFFPITQQSTGVTVLPREA